MANCGYITLKRSVFNAELSIIDNSRPKKHSPFDIGPNEMRFVVEI